MFGKKKNQNRLLIRVTRTPITSAQAFGWASAVGSVTGQGVGYVLDVAEIGYGCAKSA